MFSPETLIAMRNARRLSQEEFARNSGIATVTVPKLEPGKTVDPKASTLLKLFWALDCYMDAYANTRTRSLNVTSNSTS